MDIWNKILSAKYTEPKKPSYFPKRSCWKSKWRGLNKSELGWLEPMTEWIKEAENLPKIARESHLFTKKMLPKKSLARTSSWPTARRDSPRRAERIFRGKMFGRRFAPPTKKSVNFLKVRFWCPQQESNLQLLLRREPFYPLNYEGFSEVYNFFLLMTIPRAGMII